VFIQIRICSNIIICCKNICPTAAGTLDSHTKGCTSLPIEQARNWEWERNFSMSPSDKRFTDGFGLMYKIGNYHIRKENSILSVLMRTILQERNQQLGNPATSA